MALGVLFAWGAFAVAVAHGAEVFRAVVEQNGFHMANESQIVVFWSWQLDSPSDANKNFIEKCLTKACKRVGKDHAIIISVDRDTKGVGGTPAIAETILAKIRNADIFVWDATFVNLTPKAAPNPNVLFELGYAFAVLGEGRLIGVMNTHGVPHNTALPFDLNHRRWPIKYALPSTRRSPAAVFSDLVERGRQAAEKLPPSGKSAFDKVDNLLRSVLPQGASRDVVQEALTNDLVVALKAALKESKDGALRSDVDFNVARTLWEAMDSEWLRNWHEGQCSYPQYEVFETIKVFGTYIRLPDKPENRFRDEQLAALHNAVVNAMGQYLNTSGTERVPDPVSRGKYVISTKASDRYVENYDAKYARQLKNLEIATENLWAAWDAYVNELRTRYPEIVTSGEAQS